MKRMILYLAMTLLLLISTICLFGCSKTQDSSSSFEIVDGKFSLEVVKAGEIKKEKISTIEDKYDYDLYYYNLDEVNLVSGNSSIALEDALEDEIITLDMIVEKAKADFEMGAIEAVMIKDGGSMLYYYPEYTIIKYNSLDGKRDVVIGDKGVRINDID